MWAQIGGTIATIAYGLISDGGLTGTEVAVFCVQAVGVAVVWYQENTPQAPYAKGVAAAYTAGAAVLVLALDNGVTGAEWGQIGVAALTAVIVIGLPPAGTSTPTRRYPPGRPAAA